MDSQSIMLPDDWKEFLLEEFHRPYMADLKEFLRNEKRLGHIIYPTSKEIFNAFNLCPLEKVKVVIIGQDPYHGEGQAHGLSFSVKKGVKPPPSLQNIFKELNSDLNIPIPEHGDLTAWANQGVLMLNAVLSVKANQPASHQGKGWELFTDAVIKKLQDSKMHLVFILWGRFAQSKASLIDPNKHLILESAHPSPFSAYNGFFGNRHFSKTNTYLKQFNFPIIDWDLNKKES
jgi:uracil-DNA glycosylase